MKNNFSDYPDDDWNKLNKSLATAKVVFKDIANLKKLKYIESGKHPIVGIQKRDIFTYTNISIGIQSEYLQDGKEYYEIDINSWKKIGWFYYKFISRRVISELNSIEIVNKEYIAKLVRGQFDGNERSNKIRQTK